MSLRPTITRLFAAVFLALLANGLFPAHSARAASVVYVVPGGAGKENGSNWANAKDLQPALVAATVGDQIWAKAGTYHPSATGDRAASFALKSSVAIYGGFSGTETQLAQRNITANPTILSGDLAGNDRPSFMNNGENSYHVVTSSNTDSSAILDGFTISGGNASILNQYPLYLGGGIYNRNSSATLRNLTVAGNHVIGSGGGIYNEGGALTLLNLTVSGNQADVNGGGLVNQGGALALTNLVISGNAAVRGGGMFNYGSSPKLTNITVSRNFASQGGGVYTDPASSPQIRNSIFWGDSGGELFNAGISPLVSFSIVQGGYAGIGNRAADPLFNSSSDLHLRLTSPAIDAGDSTLAELPAIDRDGNPRRIDVSEILDTVTGASPAIDIGAYEARSVIYVKWSATPGQNNGTSWADAYLSLQSALAAAQPGQAIWVAGGVRQPYLPSATGDRSASFTLKSGVAIYGGFAGTETELAQRNLDENLTILSGDLAGNDMSIGDIGENSYHVVKGISIDSSAILDGFIITSGNANDDSKYGGGLYNQYGSPTLRNLTIASNRAINGGGIYNSFYSSPILSNVTIFANAAQYGGGIFNLSDSNPSLKDVTISGNSAVNNGGGMFNADNSRPSLKNVTIRSNVAANGHGGGMFNAISSPILTDVAISSNSAAKAGGGMFNTELSEPALRNVAISGNSAAQGGGMYNSGGSSPTLTDVTISGNTGNGSDSAGHGGGIYNAEGSTPTLRNVAVINNSANQGGGVYDRGSRPFLTNVTISGNTADNGGGMYIYATSSLTLTNIIISANRATYGGGMYVAGKPSLVNFTISGNVAQQGGGIYTNGSRLQIRNSILWGDSNGEIYDHDPNTATSVRYSIVEGDYSGKGNLASDPQFVAPPQSASGSGGDLHLSAGSPALGTGDSALCPRTDRDGNPRPAGAACDLGAYEMP